MLTGIPPSVWADEGDRAIATALDLLRRTRLQQRDDGQVSSG